MCSHMESCWAEPWSPWGDLAGGHTQAKVPKDVRSSQVGVVGETVVRGTVVEQKADATMVWNPGRVGRLQEHVPPLLVQDMMVVVPFPSDIASIANSCCWRTSSLDREAAPSGMIASKQQTEMLEGQMPEAGDV